jgi:hypothetical protein
MADKTIEEGVADLKAKRVELAAELKRALEASDACRGVNTRAGQCGCRQRWREGSEAVRRSAATNMLDRPTVIGIARELGWHEAADWIETNMSAYAELVFCGLGVDDEASRPY